MRNKKKLRKYSLKPTWSWFSSLEAWLKVWGLNLAFTSLWRVKKALWQMSLIGCVPCVGKRPRACQPTGAHGVHAPNTPQWLPRSGPWQWKALSPVVRLGDPCFREGGLYKSFHWPTHSSSRLVIRSAWWSKLRVYYTLVSTSMPHKRGLYTLKIRLSTLQL